jgi:hypothetical protein
MALIVLLGACGGPAATPTLAPVGITVFAPGTPVPAAQATTTPTAQAAATATLAPGEPSSTAVPLYGPDTYPAGINPLTGEAADSALINRIPIAAKISNFPYGVRPQSGLGLADVVVEHLAEAGVTRFTAIFLQHDSPEVGSIRSARFIDTEIAPMFGALLVTSGSSLGTMAHLRQSPWFYGDNGWRLVSEESRYVCPPLCRKTPDDANTLFASTEALRAATAAQASTAAAQSGFAFTARVPPGGTPVSEVLVDFSPAAHVSWRYNAQAGRYDRWQDKDPSLEMAAHMDAVTGKPITASNVAILFVNHQNNFVPEDFRDGGNCGLEIQLWTIGPAKIFRDGQFYDGRWHRDESTQWHLRLEDNAGNVIPLRPGNTWLGVVGLTADEALEEASTYHIHNRVLDTRTVCPIPPTETPTVTPEGWVDPNVTPDPNATVDPNAAATETVVP